MTYWNPRPLWPNGSNAENLVQRGRFASARAFDLIEKNPHRSVYSEMIEELCKSLYKTTVREIRAACRAIEILIEEIKLAEVA